MLAVTVGAGGRRGGSGGEDRRVVGHRLEIPHRMAFHAESLNPDGGKHPIRGRQAVLVGAMGIGKSVALFAADAGLGVDLGEVLGLEIDMADVAIGIVGGGVGGLA